MARVKDIAEIKIDGTKVSVASVIYAICQQEKSNKKTKIKTNGTNK